MASNRSLALQIYFYSKLFKLKHALLQIQCIDNFTRIPKSPHLLFYAFSTNYYEFSKWSIQICQNQKKRNLNLARGSLQKTYIKYKQMNPFWHYSQESLSIHLTPWRTSYSCSWSLASLHPAGSWTLRRSSRFWRRWSTSASEKLRGSIQGPAQT